MKTRDWLIAFFVIAGAALLANLVALKIAADQVNGAVSSNPFIAALGKLSQ